MWVTDPPGQNDVLSLQASYVSVLYGRVWNPPGQNDVLSLSSAQSAFFSVIQRFSYRDVIYNVLTSTASSFRAYAGIHFSHD